MAIRLLPLTQCPVIILDKPIVFIGRHRDCDVQLTSSKVSRRHCCVAEVDGNWMIRDLGSTNGVRINGTRVQQAWLRSGDELAIADLRWRLERDEQRASHAGRSSARQVPPVQQQQPATNYPSSEQPLAIPEDEAALDPQSPPAEAPQLPDAEQVDLEPLSQPFETPSAKRRRHLG